MKRLETTIKEIDGYTYYIKPFPAFTTAGISGELASVLSPVIGALAPIIEKIPDKANAGEDSKSGAQKASELFGVDFMDMNIADVLPAICDALANVSGEKLEHLLKTLLVTNKNISVRGEATDGDVTLMNEDLANEIFCGDLQNMILLCFEVVKINFKGFFKKLVGQSGNQKGPTGAKKG